MHTENQKNPKKSLHFYLAATPKKWHITVPTARVAAVLDDFLAANGMHL
jgi:hypothetical protein